jgi:hypothetical protein
MGHHPILYVEVGPEGYRMTRPLNKLSAQTVKAAKAGKHSDGGGL